MTTVDCQSCLIERCECPSGCPPDYTAAHPPPAAGGRRRSGLGRSDRPNSRRRAAAFPDLLRQPFVLPRFRGSDYTTPRPSLVTKGDGRKVRPNRSNNRPANPASSPRQCAVLHHRPESPLSYSRLSQNCVPKSVSSYIVHNGMSFRQRPGCAGDARGGTGRGAVAAAGRVRADRRRLVVNAELDRLPEMLAGLGLKATARRGRAARSLPTRDAFPGAPSSCWPCLAERDRIIGRHATVRTFLLRQLPVPARDHPTRSGSISASH
jgi:hypothetical protein